MTEPVPLFVLYADIDKWVNDKKGNQKHQTAPNRIKNI